MALATSAFAAAPLCGDVFDVKAPDFWEQIQETSISTWKKTQTEFNLRWGRNFDPDMRPLKHFQKGEYKETLWKSMALATNATSRTLLNADSFLIKSEVGNVLEKIYDNPRSKLTEAEEGLIRRHRLVGYVEKQRKFSIENPHWKYIRKTVNSTALAMMGLGFALAIDHAIDAQESLLTFDEYVRKIETEDAVTVHLLTETVPFTRSALRIGSKVYTYASGPLTLVSVRDYFKSQNELPRDSAAPSPGITEKITAALTEKIGAKRTVRFLELKLTEAETEALRKDLDSNLGKVYGHVSTVTTDSTMFAQALKRTTPLSIPDFVDAYANLTDTALWLSNELGGKTLGQRGLINPKKTTGPWLGLKSFFTDYMESRTLVASAALSYPARLGLDAWNSEKALQWFAPERAAQVLSWKNESTLQIEAILHQENFSKDDLTDFLNTLEKRTLADLQSEKTQLLDLIKAQAKLEVIAKFKAQLHTK